MKNRNALVLGATGGIGGEVASRLRASGWTIQALHRNAVRQGSRVGFTWIQGDAMRPEDVMAAAEGVSVIVHAVNPPGYRKWSVSVLPMLESSIAAAKVNEARIVLPGTVYNYGPAAFPKLDETSPQNPVTAKGKIRAEMERRLREATRSGARVLIVRAGDFFGPHAGNSWFAQGLVKPGRPLTGITYPGKPGIGHQWAYLPDAAETMAQLLEREAALEPFATFHMNGHWDRDGTQMVAAIKAAAGKPDMPVRAFPWRLLTLASPVVPLFRELRELRYLWQVPLRMTNARLVNVLGSEPHTPLEDAVRTTLAGLGCLAERSMHGPGMEARSV